MARKILNRRELRAAAEAAERLDDEEDVGTDDEADEGEEQEKPAKKKPAAKRKSRSKEPKEVRLKAFWAVFNQAMKRIALFEFHERSQADKKAADLTNSQGTPHFVQLVKEIINE